MASILQSALALLHSEVTITVTHPLGSVHPEYEWSYPINCGTYPALRDSDGSSIEAYVLVEEDSLEHFTGTVIAVIERLDVENPKLVLAPAGVIISEGDVAAAVHFQEHWFDYRIRMDA
jgi:inorganic pyrophosphatase